MNFSTAMRCGAALCALSLITHSPAARANEIDDGTTTIIVTGQAATSEAAQQVSQTPGGADLVTHDEYADKSLVSLRDVLAFSPGVYLQPRYGQEVRISVRGSGLSRGFHMRGLTLLQDGVPINLADDNGDFQELDPSFFDHLEVYRGANALRLGSGTLGGAINGVTPTGRDADGIYMRGDVGSFNSYRGLVSIGGESGPADYWAAISADSSDGDRDHAQRRSLRFHGNIGLKLSDNISTRFYASVNNIDQELPGALDLNTVLTAPKTGSFIGDQARDIDSLRLQNRTSFTFGDMMLHTGIFLNAKSLYHPIFQVVDQESVDKGGFFRLDWEQGAFAATLGGEARFGNVNSKRFVNIDGARGAPTFQADQQARTASLYGELRYTPLDRLTLIAGGIFADGKRQQQQNLNSFAGGATDIFARADFQEFSPKFGLLFEATPDIQFYGNISRSAEFPGFIELAQIASFVPIEAQTAWTYELGSRGSAGPVSWDISAYRSEISGELLQFTVGPDIPTITFNAGRTLHQGLEAALSIEPAPWLRLRQVYSYNDFRFRGDQQYGDNQLPVVPRHVYRGDLRLGKDGLHITPNIEWVPRGAFADYNNQLRVPSYTLLGISAGVNIAEGIDLFVDARNLADKNAVGDISAVISANSASRIFQPTERRAIYGGLRARF
ncbi:TonB-dependent receptor family protein [Sphingorhabdus arenilitoris]|uniref:TonB-dependent receptor family protein n=1 Tax=Sphingorhabdus arenilitoris TaxID=1490041 RepID=A0ABV8RCG5_9SPHN